MKTLASALDAILEGALGRAGDILLGRYKALENATVSWSWEVAQEYEASPQRENTIVSDAERQRAVATLMRRVRLDAALRSGAGLWVVPPEVQEIPRLAGRATAAEETAAMDSLAHRHVARGREPTPENATGLGPLPAQVEEPLETEALALGRCQASEP